MKTYQAVLYDIDGTLLNTVNMNMYPLLRIIKEELGEERTLADVVKFMAYTGMKVMDELGIQDPEATYQRWVRYVNEYPEGATPYPGMVDTLERLLQLGVRQAVVSTQMRGLNQRHMHAYGHHQKKHTAHHPQHRQGRPGRRHRLCLRHLEWRGLWKRGPCRPHSGQSRRSAGPGFPRKLKRN